MAKIPIVDKEKCIGCGTCVSIAPEVFQIAEDGKSKVINPQGAPEEKIAEAIKSCPVQAISWQE